MKRRAIILMMDSFGLGGAPDAQRFGDTGANTLGHIAAACAAGQCEGPRRSGRLHLPNLTKLGLACAGYASSGEWPAGLDHGAPVTGAYGFAMEQSLGKDTPSGHWELAGVPVREEWGYFPDTHPCFPERLIQDLIVRAELPGVLGERHASGTQILEDLGEAHIRSGKPIVYTSADSVFQIAAHADHFGLERLYRVCEIARELVDDYRVGRVIARPFRGEKRGDFARTPDRRDYATPPPRPTLLERLVDAGHEVVAVGKVADIYAHKGISRVVKAAGNPALFDVTLAELDHLQNGALLFTNFVDFDMHYGHRRDTAGYALALEDFDARLPEFISRLRSGDLALITADHGCDPTWPGTEHTRENVPVLLFGPGITAGDIGARDTFADMGQTLAAHLGINNLESGERIANAIDR